jgi:predicted RNase H-like nuclease (RuvC/YqgF family)
MKSKWLIWGSIGLSVLLLIALSKNNTQTKKRLEYGANLNSAIEEFEENRQDYSSQLTNIAEQTTTDLNNGNHSVNEVAENWEVEWKRLNKQLETLKSDFEEVGKTSNEYFGNLNELAANIIDDGLRKEETRKNNELQERWTIAYQDAARSIKNIENIMLDGNDFYNVLLASSIRQQVEGDIEELEVITVRALKLLSELEDFSNEGKKLIGLT